MENENPFISQDLVEQFELNIQNGQLQNVTNESIFQLIRNITDPEHPYSLEQLSIVSVGDIKVYELTSNEVQCRSGQPIKTVEVTFTPTVPHCSMAGIIGLCIHFQLKKFVNSHLIIVKIKKDTHSTYQSLNKQLYDKDRVMAAFENEGMIDLINSCINHE